MKPDIQDELLRRRKREVIIEDWGTIKTMAEAAVTVSNALVEKTPGFFRSSPRTYFMSSDNPVSCLRVVTLEDKKTIHNAFPDRGFKP